MERKLEETQKDCFRQSNQEGLSEKATFEFLPGRVEVASQEKV